MKKKYVMYRFPAEAYFNFNKKKEVLKQIVKQETNKERNISLADTLRFFSQKPIYIYNDEVINYLKKKKKTRGNIT